MTDLTKMMFAMNGNNNHHHQNLRMNHDGTSAGMITTSFHEAPVDQVIGVDEDEDDPCAPIADIDNIFTDDEDDMISSTSFQRQRNKTEDDFQPLPFLPSSSGMLDLREVEADNDCFRFSAPSAATPLPLPAGHTSALPQEQRYQQQLHRPDAIPSDADDFLFLQILDRLEDTATSQDFAPSSIMMSPACVIVPSPATIPLPVSAAAQLLPPRSFKHMRPCAKPKRRVVSDESACCDVATSSSSSNNNNDFPCSLGVFGQDEDRAPSPSPLLHPVVKRQRVGDTNTSTANAIATAIDIAASCTTNSSSSSHSSVEDASSLADGNSNNNKFRVYQAEKWHQKFQELIDYKNLHGHTQVPHGYDRNPTLARWAKRQRYQYKLFQEGKPSTMTEERIQDLERLGFVWDSHTALWEERYQELQGYVQTTGNANVPSTYPPNAKLAIWVKCQRRQFKLLLAGEASNMTYPRVERLNKLDFIWEIRRTGYLS